MYLGLHSLNEVILGAVYGILYVCFIVSHGFYGFKLALIYFSIKNKNIKIVAIIFTCIVFILVNVIFIITYLY